MRQVKLDFLNTNCETHGTVSSLPCAWPNCPHGIEEDEFEGTYISGNGIKFLRRKWESPLGEYYSWDKLTLPNWFSVKDIFWNEARRHNLVPTTKHPDIVYHYTSLEGLIGIIQSRNVWMTDFGYLNDRHELSYGVDLVSEALNEMLEDSIDSDIKQLLLAWKENIKRTPNRVCISSFSSDGDSLSQWRAYGPVAIGLSVRDLALHVEDGIFQNVEYDAETQTKLIKIYLNHLVNAFTVDMQEDRLCKAPDLYHRNSRLVEFITFLKNPAFQSEHEYRLAYINDPEVLETFNLATPPKSFRVSNGKIIPYVPSTSISLSGYEGPPLKITEIIIGPENDALLEQGIKELLTEHNLDEVDVRLSTVPLRK